MLGGRIALPFGSPFVIAVFMGVVTATGGGVNFDLTLTQFYQGVTSGGVDTNSEYGGKVDYRLKVDGHKLFGLWEGLFASLHAETRFGKDISADAGGFALPNTALLYPLAHSGNRPLVAYLAAFGPRGTPADQAGGAYDAMRVLGVSHSALECA